MKKYEIASFSTGEISPKFRGRVDLPQYKSGCKSLINFFPQQTGGAEKRPGTMHGASAAGKCILIPWIKNETEYLFLELSEDKIRYYSYDEDTQKASLIEDSGSPVETDISGASWIATSNLDDIKWVQDSVTIVYDTMYFACPGFTLRKLVRTSDISWAFSVASLTDYTGTNAEVLEIFEDRLIIAEENVIHGSKQASHLDFGHEATPLATDGFAFTFAAKENTIVKWLAATSTLLFGTASAVCIVAGKEDVLDGTSLAIWPQKQSGIGCSSVQPVMFQSFLVFVQKGGKRLHMIEYSQNVEKYVTTDLTFFAEHITGTGIKQMAYQINPEPMLWAVTNAGVLVSMVFSSVTQSIGWCRHNLDGIVESIAVIQTSDEDVLCLSVLRDSTRYICTMPKRDYGNVEDAHFVDFGVVWSGGDAVTITSITAGDSGTGGASVVTATAHGFEDDEIIRTLDVTGAELDGELYTVKNKTADTFDLYSLDGSNKVYIGAACTGGTASQVENTVSGLDHLEGETVSVLGDGAVIPPVVIDSGNAVLSEYANKLHVGLGYTAILQPNSIGVSLSILKSITKMYAKFLDGVVYKYGQDLDHLTEQSLKEHAPIMGVAPELITEDLVTYFDGDRSTSPEFMIVSDHPLPLTVLNIIAEVET